MMRSKAKMVLIDDDPVLRLAMSRLLKQVGHTVIEAATGEEGIRLACEMRPDLIIVDVVLPDMNGVEVCRRVQAFPELSGIHMILISGIKKSADDQATGLEAGVHEYIARPVTNREFLARIEAVLRNKRITDYLGLSWEQASKTALERARELEITNAEYKQAQENLHLSEEKYRRLHESMMDAFVLVGMAGHLKEWNNAYRDMLGYSDEELGHLTYEDMTPAKWHKNEARIVEEQILKRGFSDVYEKEYRHKDGSIFPVELKTFLLRDKNLQPSGMWAIVRDITQRNMAAEEKQQLEVQLYQAQKLESVGRLAGGVAHDFNNLLSAILGYTEMVMDDLPAGHIHAEHLKEVYDAGKRAKILTRQLLAFSRKQVLEMRITDMNAVITGFEKLLNRIIGEDIELKPALSHRKLPVMADTTQMEQVLMNLAVNARDAMPEGGTLIIETDEAEWNEHNLEQNPRMTPGVYVMIKVSDTGCGMDTITLKHLFEPFFTTKERDKGTGLGLATSYGIIKQHGGFIWACSESGRGTTFTIYLPLCSEEPRQEVQKPAPRKPSTGSATVLVVEDDIAVLRLTVRILESAGYQVIAFEKPGEAVIASSRHTAPIHLVLSDVIMPGMNGPEVFQRIKEHHPEARILYMSGYTAETITQSGALKEGLHFLQKPFSNQGLLEKVFEVLKEQTTGFREKISCINSSQRIPSGPADEW